MNKNRLCEPCVPAIVVRYTVTVPIADGPLKQIPCANDVAHRREYVQNNLNINKNT